MEFKKELVFHLSLLDMLNDDQEDMFTDQKVSFVDNKHVNKRF